MGTIGGLSTVRNCVGMMGVTIGATGIINGLGGAMMNATMSNTSNMETGNINGLTHHRRQIYKHVVKGL